MTQTGNYYLMHLTHKRGKSMFMVLDYSTNCTSGWDPDFSNIKLIPYKDNNGIVPSLSEIASVYDKQNSVYACTLLPLTSPSSAISQYPELFI